MLHRTIRLYISSFSGLSRNVWLLSFVMLINRSGTMVIPFLGIFLTQEEGFTMLQTGTIMSCIGLGSVLGTFLGGQITDKIGYYGVQFWSLLLSGIGFLLMPFVDGFYFWCVTIFNEDFYWKVRKKISHDESHNDQLGIPIQHKSGGQLLIVYIGYGRSEGYGRESLESITPSIIKDCILKAIKLGWNFSEKEKPISMVNGELTTDTKTAKWKAK